MILPREHHDRRDTADDSEELRDADRADIQAVRAQALDPCAAGAVPCGIEQRDLALEPAFFRIEMQQDEAGEVPEGLIEEGRVDHALAVDGHAPGEGRRAAVGLAVDEIAPAADALADEQAERREIAQARERELFDAAVHEQADERADDAAVDSDAALPDGDDLARVLRVVAPFENDVVDTRADDAEGHADDEAVGEVIRGDAEVLRPGIDVERGEDKAGADDDAVPVDVLSEHGAGHAAEREFQTEVRKTDSVFHVSTFL